MTETLDQHLLRLNLTEGKTMARSQARNVLEDIEIDFQDVFQTGELQDEYLGGHAIEYIMAGHPRALLSDLRDLRQSRIPTQEDIDASPTVQAFRALAVEAVTPRWDAADHLGTGEMRKAYLEAAAEEGEACLKAAKADVARAKWGKKRRMRR